MTGGFQAAWDADAPSKFELADQHTSVTLKDIGGGIKIHTKGVSAQVVGGRTKCWFHITKPGMHSLWYAIEGHRIYLDTYKWRLKQVAPKATAYQAEEGVVYVFNALGLKKYKGDTYQPDPIQTISLPEAVDAFLERMVSAAQDVCRYLRGVGETRVVSMLSGGTDSTLVTWALKQAGMEVDCLVVGRSWEDFDPQYAREYAKQLDVSLELVSLPEEDVALQALLDRTITSIEQSDFSNVLMAMCTTLARDRARGMGVTTVFHGHYADDIVGNGISTTGGYLKHCRENGEEPTAEGWQAWRLKWCMHTIPNNTQVDKVSKVDGMAWRALFYHPLVYDFVLSLPLSITPVETNKVLYKATCDRIIKDGAWGHHRKVGYYTGSGIGKIKLENQVLSEENMRATYNRLKP